MYIFTHLNNFNALNKLCCVLHFRSVLHIRKKNSFFCCFVFSLSNRQVELKMLAHGVNLNSTILGSHSSSGNNTNSSSNSSSGGGGSNMNAEIESSNAALNNQSTVPSSSTQHDSNHAVEINMPHKVNCWKLYN